MFGKKIFGITTLLVILLWSCLALGSEITYYPETAMATVSLESIDASNLRMTLECPDTPLQFVQKNNDSRVWLEYDNEGFTDESGKASLPLITRFIAIPPEAQLRVDILNRDTRVVEHVKIVPVAPDGQDALSTDWADDPQWLSGDAAYPQESVTVGQGMRLRNLWIVPVTMAPARYYPKDQRLEIVRHLEIQMALEGGTFRDPSMIQGPIVESYDKMYKSLVANYNFLELDQQTIRGTYLIICPNDANVISYLQDLVTWKNRKGYRAVLATTQQTGSSTTSIRNYIRNAYTTWEYPPEFVCLVGDASGSISIPTDGSQYDHFYSMMDTDVLADVAVGRLSCEDINTLRTIINKILSYERNPYMGQTAWYQQGFVAGGSGSGISVIHTKKAVRWRMLQNGFTQVDTMWYTMGSNFVTPIANAFNHGIGMFNYRGYMNMSSWTNSNTNNLSNGYMLPIVITLTCGTGTFNSGTSVSEGFLRAGSPTSFKGGIASIGTATLGTHTKYNNCMDIGLFAGLFEADVIHLGEALMYGKAEMRRNYPGGEGDSFIYWNNLMGDPGLMVWKQIPQAMTMTYEDTVALGSNVFAIHVVDQNQQPLEEAYACLWQSSGTLYQVGYTDANGIVELNSGAAQLGSFYVTVTKEGYIPQLGQTTVVTMAQALGVSSAALDDDNTGSSQGNGDGNWNPNERVEIRPTLQNQGTQSIQNVQATLTTDDNLMTIVQGNGSFGNIAAGGSAQINNAFVVSLNPRTPNGHLCRLRINLTGTGFSQQLFLEYNAVSYELNFKGLTVQGSNAVLEPGETANLLIRLQNDGDFAGNNITAMLHSDPEYLEMVDSVAVYGNIAIGASVQNTSDALTVHALPNVIPGVRPYLILITTSSEGIVDTVEVRIQIQQATPQGSPLGPDMYGYFCFDNTDTAYSQAPHYAWIEIDTHSGGQGTQINLTDYGNEQDDTQLVPLPFTFRYYGQNYSQVSVCSNGWLAMGNQTYFEDFRNWSIPSPQGPPAMIAPLWDDLILTSGSGVGKVYYRYDSTNHWFIVEWSHAHTYTGNYEEDFEVVLYDPMFYPTFSGDGDILFQYYHVVNAPSAGSDNSYATVGIENYNQDDGIQYTYSNTYPPQAAALSDGRAIKFTTAPGLAPEPPSISLHPTEFHFNLSQGQEGHDSLWIANVGASPLIFSIQALDDRGRPFVSFPVSAPSVPMNAPPIPPSPSVKGRSNNPSVNSKGSAGNPGAPVEVDSGGPDMYGYTWKDSHDLGGPTYQWVDISTIGTEVVWPGNPDESSYGPVDVGFNFPFYGILYSTLRICSDGYLSFTDSSVTYTNTALPSVDAPANLVAPWWDDLDPVFGGHVYFWTNHVDTFIVAMDSIMGWNSTTPRGGPYYFETILTRDGTIRYQYQNMGTVRLNESTIGIQNALKTIGLTVAFNTQYVQNGLAVEFTAPLNWLSVTPSQGTVATGDSISCRVTATTLLLEPGDYDGILRVQSNDVQNPSVEVDVTLHVIAGGEQPPTVLDIPNQTIDEGGTFATINLDNYVTDPVYTPQQMVWTAFGAVNLTVTIVNRVATVTTPNEDWYGQETITFRATNPINLWDSDQAAFTVLSVNDPPEIDPHLPNITFRADSSATLDLTQYEHDVETPDSLLTWTFVGNDSVNIVISQAQVATFTSLPGFIGVEQVIFTLHDLDGGTADDTILVTVQPMTGVPGNGEWGIPNDYFLAQNYPNPFNPKTLIRFGLPEPALVKMTVFNILGQVVAVPINGYMEAGYHYIIFETTGLSSGLYFYSISTPKYQAIRKMVLLR
jgi:hypothetical protein